jgi:ABC-type branched-subunit amino acid transport system permease subunit
MSTQSASNRVDIVTTQLSSFERFAGLSAILAGIAGILYSISCFFRSPRLRKKQENFES